MGNLGWYQVMTKLAKKVGGPISLFAITATGGYLLGRTAEAGVKSMTKKVSKSISEKRYSNTVYEVVAHAKDKQGLVFNSGDNFNVLERDGDAVLIEIIGNANNPYFVSAKFLTTISNFK